jgi:hypothetical protein
MVKIKIFGTQASTPTDKVNKFDVANASTNTTAAPMVVLDRPELSIAETPEPAPTPPLAPLETVIYTDYAFNIQSPRLLSNISENDGGNQSLWFDYESKYNFFINEYEDLLERVPETLIPNLYVFLSEMDRRIRDIKTGKGIFTHTIGTPGPATPDSPLAINLSPEVNWNRHITLGNQIKNTLIDDAINSKIGVDKTDRIKRQVNSFIGAEKDFASYYYEWNNVVKGIDDIITFLDNLFFLSRYKNIVVPYFSAKPEFLEEPSSQKYRQFPMYNKISFKTDGASTFADGMRDTGVGNYLIKEVIDNEEIAISNGQLVKRPWNKWIKLDRVRRPAPKFAGGGVEPGYYRYWDMGEFLQSLLPDPKSLTDSLELSNYYENLFNTKNDTNSIYVYASSFDERGQIRTLINEASSNRQQDLRQLNIYAAGQAMRFIRLLYEKITGYEPGQEVGQPENGLFRTYQDVVIDGKPAYSETAFYRIEKRRASDGLFLQNIYLPNSSDVDVLTYYDTQVKYNSEYTYNIYAYQMVVGNKYRYKLNNMPYGDGPSANFSPSLEDPSFNKDEWIKFVNQMVSSNEYTEVQYPDFGLQFSPNPSTALPYNEAEICVLSEPSIVLVEVPQTTFNTIIVDRPPMPPDVSLIPYRAKSDKILITFNGAVGEEEKEFISLSKEDDELFEKYRLNQKVPVGSRKIKFKSDDPSIEFEVWRTDKKPTSWYDFNFYKKVTSNELFSNPSKKASSASFKDKVIANKKYYYTFRAIDVHGNVSNPSVIYEMRMNDDNGTVWMDLQTFESPNFIDVKTPTKSGKKIIQIKPSFLQSTINEQQSGLTDSEGNRITDLSGFNLDNQDLVLGSDDLQRSIWSGDSKPRKFKLRLTSKKTGKKIDFNFYCRVNHIKDPDI